MLETYLKPTGDATRNAKPTPIEFPTKIPHKSSNGTVSTEQIAAFIGSSSTLISKLPKSRSLVDLTGDIVANLYLSLQVRAIDKSLFDLSAGEDSYYLAPLDPLDLYQQPFQIEPFGLYLTTDRLVIHQQAVHETLQIQSVLRSPDSNASIQVGAWKMEDLSLLLGALGMFKEASRICSWVVRIYRTLVRVDREVYTPHLVLSLFNLSWLYHNDHNLEAAHEAITESVGIGWSLHMSTSLVRERSRVQLSRSLRGSAEIQAGMGEDTQALVNASKAVRVLEELFSDHLSREIGTESGFILREFNWDELLKIIEHGTIFEYAEGLATLSFILRELEFPAAAIKVATKSLETFHLASSFYPEGHCQEGTITLLEHISELEKVLPPQLPHEPQEAALSCL